jgi:hypothetical protein
LQSRRPQAMLLMAKLFCINCAETPQFNAWVESSIIGSIAVKKVLEKKILNFFGAAFEIVNLFGDFFDLVLNFKEWTILHFLHFIQPKIDLLKIINHRTLNFFDFSATKCLGID